MNESPTRTTDSAGEQLQPEVSLGLLLSPDEFARECGQTHLRPKFSSWALGIELPDAVVRVLESDFVPVSTELALFSSERGMVYPVVALQAGALQIRVMLSLADPRTQTWLKEYLSTGRMHVAVNVAEKGQLVVIQGRCDANQLAEAEALVQKCQRTECEQGVAQGFLDRLHLGQRLLNVDAVRSGIPGFHVESVRLVIVVDGDGQPQEAELASNGEVFH